MADLYDPPSRLLLGVALLDEISLSAASDDMRDVAVVFDGAKVFRAPVASVSTQVLVSSMRWILAFDDDGVEDRVKALAVMDVGPGHDERQRDATAVHQQMPLAALFFPDPSGWAPRPPGPVAPSSLRRPHSASARQCPASGRTLPSLLSTVPRKSPQPPTQGTACGLHSHCRSAPWAMPSTGSLCAVRTRWPRTPVEPAWAVARRRACARRSCLSASAQESTAQRAARTHLSRPMTEHDWPSSRSRTASAAARVVSLTIYG